VKKWVLGALFLSACASGGSMVTMSGFADVPIGATKQEVIESVGKPVSERNLSDGSVEYEYVERFKEGARTINERHYFIVIKDGKVVAKRISQQSPPAYGFDSYDMQTTQR
jgi:hypothetical protein